MGRKPKNLIQVHSKWLDKTLRLRVAFPKFTLRNSASMRLPMEKVSSYTLHFSIYMKVSENFYNREICLTFKVGSYQIYLLKAILHVLIYQETFSPTVDPDDMLMEERY